MPFSEHPKKGPSARESKRQAVASVHKVGVSGCLLGKGAINGQGKPARSKSLGKLGIYRVSPPLGPYSMEDTMGMGLAVCILIRTLDPGRTEELIQFFDSPIFEERVLEHLPRAISALERNGGYGAQHFQDLGDGVSVLRILV
jgi:hypothetical protein